MRYTDRRYLTTKFQFYQFLKYLKRSSLRDTTTYWNNIVLYMALKRYFKNDISIITGKILFKDTNDTLPHFVVRLKIGKDTLTYDYSINLMNQYDEYTQFTECDDEELRLTVFKTVAFCLKEMHS